jgi:phosphoribosylformylglycinamidine (FGAM) synthase PurS component
MEILSAGAFINLENQEKIEQLKYTARELANAAIETEGFVNEEGAARKLALEFWQGLEYMCRESEKGAIQNIFTGEFLQRLRELRPCATVSEITPTDETPGFVQERTSQTITAEDEFLGVLAPENQETDLIENTVEIQEIPISTEDFAETEQIEEIEFVENESDSKYSEENVSQIAAATLANTEVETTEIEVAGSLSLPEKEPYQFGKCTVTATIQLLPVDENSDLRRAVFSVKTHDFAPDYSLVQLSDSKLTASLAPELEKVLAKYQADLPFKVMDKMKKEKAAPKRNTPKVSTETKSVSQESAKPKEVDSTQNTEAATAQTNLAPAPQTAETGAQGSLFVL